MKGNLAGSTYHEYKADLKNHVYPVLGDKQYSRVSRVMIREFISAKRTEGYDPSTVKNMLAPVRGMYNQAADDGEPITNPAAKIGKHNKQTEPKREINPLTHEEVPTLLQKALVLVPLDYPLILCALHTGIRQGERISLKAGDIDFKNRLIHVQRYLSRGTIKAPKEEKPVGLI